VALVSSLRTRVFLASALVAVLSLAFALQFVTGRVAAQAEAELRRGLVESAERVAQDHAARLEQLRLVAQLLADLPKLKAAVETSDPPTVEPVAADYLGRVGADGLVVTDAAGRSLAAVGSAPVAPARDAPPVAFKDEGRAVLEVVTVPISIGLDPPEVLGWLSLTERLDQAAAVRLRAQTGSELAFALGGRVVTSTLSPHDALAPALQGDDVVRVVVADNEYVAVRRRLGEGSLSALILRSRSERLAFLRTFRTALLVAGAVAVLMAILLSYAVARTVTGPLTDLTTAMRAVTATGDLSHRIPPGGPWEDEDARLLASSFNSLTESLARFQREAALRERLSALGRLSTVVAHEVRNPLMIIKAALRSLRRDGATGEEAREAAGDIGHEVDRLERIVRDVLDFARPVQPEWARCDLGALCREAAEAALAGDGPVEARLALDDAPRDMVTDGERLRTALVNILANAREAVRSREGTPPSPALQLRARRLDGGRVAIQVEDRGIGIPPEALPHVFEPYFSTRRAGSGLGLAIAKNIVESLGGTIGVESRAAEGTSVTIELPLEPAPARLEA
jgi:signal transduction histidine kinase